MHDNKSILLFGRGGVILCICVSGGHYEKYENIRTSLSKTHASDRRFFLKC